MTKLVHPRSQEGALLKEKPPLDIDEIILEFTKDVACKHENHVMGKVKTSSGEGARVFTVGKCVFCGIDMTEVGPTKEPL